jgi:hypothetical protein
VFCGCPARAHRHAASLARSIYHTEIPQKLRRTTDILLLNAYPLDADPNQITKSLWPRSLFPQAQTILFDPASDGLAYHGWSEFQKASLVNLLWGTIGMLSSHRKCPEKLRNRLSSSSRLRAAGNHHFRRAIRRTDASYSCFAAQSGTFYQNTVAKRLMADRSSLWICSEAYPDHKRFQQFPRSRSIQDWESLRRADLLGRTACRITVFPCAPLQLTRS